MPRETPDQRMKRAQKALALYRQPLSIREVAEIMDVSYGTAHSLIKMAANGQGVFRKRGTRINQEAE